MKTILILPLILLLSCEAEPLPNTNPTVNPIAQKEKVKEAFQQYKAAVLSQDGPAAAKQLSSNSIVYYDELLSKVLHGTEAEVKALSSGDMMQVVALRYFFPKEDLKSYDGRQLYEAMIANKFTEERQLARTDLGKIAVKGNKAKGQMVVNGQPSPIFFDFKKEQGAWKLDLTTTVIMTTKFVEQQAQAAQLTVPEYLEQTMNLSEEEKKSIWQPLD